jgi:hypothetical protein
MRAVDIGGGSVSDTADHSLANIPLRWMVRQILLAQCGIMFSSQALETLDISAAVFPPVSSCCASEKELQQVRRLPLLAQLRDR